MTDIPEDIMAKAREIERFSSSAIMWSLDDPSGKPLADPNGEWVRYLDHAAALLSERTASEAALEDARFSRDYWKRMHDEVKAAFLAKTGGA